MSDSLEFPTGHLDFRPVDGYIHDWLVAGPLATPLTDLHDPTVAALRDRLAARPDEPDARLNTPPAERAELELSGDDGQPVRLIWQAQRALEDHVIDLSGFHAVAHRVTAWAYAQVICASAVEAPLALGVYGPVELWLNDVRVFRHDGFHLELTTLTVPVRLSEGVNEILVRLETIAVRDYALGFRLAVPAANDDDLRVTLPTLLEPVTRRDLLAQVMAQAYLPRDVYHRGDKLTVHWAADMTEVDALSVRLQSPGGRIYAEGHPIVQQSARVILSSSLNVTDGDYEVLLMPPTEEHYVQDMRVTRRLPLQVVNAAFSSVYYGDLDKRRQEALEDAARRTGDIYAELAKLALGLWDQVNPASIQRAIGQVQQRAANSDRDLLALLAIAANHGDDGVLPQELQWALAEAIQQAKYASDDAPDGLDFSGEGHALLAAACELLAGQLYPEQVFGDHNNGETMLGADHRAVGEEKILAWLERHARHGLRAWDAGDVIADAMAALSQLVELAEHNEVVELAAAMLDKLAFGLAVHSLRGVFGGSQGAAQAHWLRSGQLSPVAGIMRLLWGTGVWNAACHAPVSLAMATGYELPEIIAAVGLDTADMWMREQDAGEDADGSFAVNRVTYRTAEYLLASAQDYRPGQAGRGEHIWQATLGPDAPVFVNDPGCSSQNDALRPNFWRGNAVLPRVAQWRDLLVAIHQGRPRDGLDFTHAYFPTGAFDEYVTADDWVCARRGNGYVALAAANKLTLVTQGPTAYRELRSPGHANSWVCHMGRAETDGTFAEFVGKVAALPVAFAGDSVQLTSLRGQTVRFGWTGALLVDGAEQPLAGYPHMDGPYGQAALPATDLDILYLEYRLRLNLVATRPAERN